MPNEPSIPKKSINYLNNKDQWPDGLWDELRGGADAPPDHLRCQHHIPGAESLRCGLPAHNDGEHCIFHTSVERDADELRSELGAAVKRNANLQGINVAGADLQGADLSGAAMYAAQFANADLRKAIFNDAKLGSANFTCAKLNNANFADAKLGRACLIGVELQDADLRQVELVYANLTEAHLGGVNLTNARLWGADLTGARLQHATLTDADLSQANLTGAHLSRAKLSGIVDLTNADLRRAKLCGIRLSADARINGVQWNDSDGIIEEERLVRLRIPGEPDEKMDIVNEFRACADVYRQIKQCYQQSGEYLTAGRFFVREMECERVAKVIGGTPKSAGSCTRCVRYCARHHLMRLVRWMAMSLCRYGEDPARLMCIMALVVLVFAGIHCLCGVANGTDLITGQTLEAISPGWACPVSWLEGFTQAVLAFYFSAVTFTSLGYGDLSPIGPLGQICCVVEAFLGIFMVAALVGCMMRKISR